MARKKKNNEDISVDKAEILIKAKGVPFIMAIDPGNTESAFVVVDKELNPLEFGKVENNKLHSLIIRKRKDNSLAPNFSVEMVASYGMPVGKDVFETVFWIGRYWEIYEKSAFKTFIYRKEEKMNLCYDMRAKDGNIMHALIDRFARHNFKNGKGTKANPDFFYGFSKDIWQAFAVAVTCYDIYLKDNMDTEQN